MRQQSTKIRCPNREPRCAVLAVCGRAVQPHSEPPGRDLLARHAEDLNAAMRRIARLAYAILDGTLIPIDRVADQWPYYSGKHKRHGVNVQVIADCKGRLIWASPALPGAVHDLTAARTHGLIDAGLTAPT